LAHYNGMVSGIRRYVGIGGFFGGGI